jgi:ureidoglycolate dehydrogenase (NAD+)
MAIAKASWGKINALAQYGLPLPLDWALDEKGQPTADAETAETLLPAGGPKGFGLGIVSGILAGALEGGRLPISRKRESLVEGSQHFFYVIDPEKFTELDRFYVRIEEAVKAFHQLQPAPGFERTRLPGERQWEEMQRAKEQGVRVHRKDAEMLKSLATAMGLTVPWD